MNTEVKEKENNKLINYACHNFQKISKNIKNPKFEHIDTWLHKTSIQYKKENQDLTVLTYPRFDYGTIIKVDFGINTGSELSGPHFAITLEKYDSTKNPVISVLPLTSQNSKNRNLELNDLIIEEFTKRLKNNLTNLQLELEKIKKMKNDEKMFEILNEKSNEIETIQQMINYYSNYAKNSYACINQITTISKVKIIKPKNQFDIIGRAKCNSKTMNIISKEIIKKFTNVKIEEYNLTK